MELQIYAFNYVIQLWLATEVHIYVLYFQLNTCILYYSFIGFV